MMMLSVKTNAAVFFFLWQHTKNTFVFWHSASEQKALKLAKEFLQSHHSNDDDDDDCQKGKVL